MTIHEKHMQLLDAVNYAKTEAGHFSAMQFLSGWREGVKDAGITVDLIAADLEYISRGVTNDLCAGKFLDWKPQAATI